MVSEERTMAGRRKKLQEEHALLKTLNKQKADVLIVYLFLKYQSRCSSLNIPVGTVVFVEPRACISNGPYVCRETKRGLLRGHRFVSHLATQLHMETGVIFGSSLPASLEACLYALTSLSGWASVPIKLPCLTRDLSTRNV